MTDLTVERPQLGPVIQIGFVVRDAEAVAARWALLFGLPAPRVVEWPLRPGMRAELRGAPIREGGRWFVLDTQELLGMLLEGRRLPPEEK